MLCVIRTMGSLPFTGLMQVYERSNREQGAREWPWEPENRQLALAEEAFYTYLSTCFFQTPEAACYLWLEQDQPVSALRCEPYRDGMILTALETDPKEEGKGYATRLLSHTLKALQEKGIQRVYVHIHRSNIASQRVHQHCGFVKTSQGGRLLDGSYSPELDTYRFDCMPE